MLKIVSIFIVLTSLVACGQSKEITVTTNQNYTIEHLNIIKNGFEGNIVIEVFDNQMKPLNDYRSIVKENGKVIFDVYQKEHRGTFYKDGKNVTIEIIKDGYTTVKTIPFSTDDEIELANFIKIKLEKE